MNFKVVHTMPEELEDIFTEIQVKRGYYLAAMDTVYMVVCAGEKPKDGYSLGVAKIHENGDNIIVDVTECSPKPGVVHKPNPCFPYTVISLNIKPKDIEAYHIIVRNTQSLSKYDKIDLKG
ncbi:MAG: protease complex subunit PrcB family protein [Tissierellia bacterium]|nr:protease complex subunit PrcB family protein [Tissierellia bacterium]